MTLERKFVAAAFLTTTASLVGLGALAAGAVEPSGTASAGERNVATFATVLGIVAGVGLLVMAAGQRSVLGRAATALAALLAALAFSVPAVLAFA